MSFPDDHGGEHRANPISAAPPEPPAGESAEAVGFARRWPVIVSVGALTVAVIGFITGTRGDFDPYRRPTAERASEPARSVAPTYASIRDAPLGPNRNRHAGAFVVMRANRPALTDEDIPPRDDEAVRAELARRATLRSYPGAPPRIPHGIPSRGPLECLLCHETGLRIGDRVAAPMSHSAERASCTQCHVPERGQLPVEPLRGGPPFADNGFVGVESPWRGPRAWPGAPPQMPHSTHMRERCDSCHGVLGQGIRTTHPWRQSCRQCHAPSAGQDLGPPRTLEGGPPAPPMAEEDDLAPRRSGR